MEIWKDIEGYEGKYQVSNLGNVKSLNYNRTGKEKILKFKENRDNYLQVGLYKDGKEKAYYVHRLVAEVFIDKVEGKDFVDHIDGNRQNNVYTNLRYCTHKENCNFELCKKHQSEAQKGKYIGEKNHMYGKTGELHHRSKPVLCLETGQIYGSTYEIERELKINHSSISACCNGKQKFAGKLNGEKLHWKYIELLPCYN